MSATEETLFSLTVITNFEIIKLQFGYASFLRFANRMTEIIHVAPIVKKLLHKKS